MDEGQESIQAMATVTLDARTLESLGPRTLDRLAELVEARLMLRRAAGEEPLLTAVAAAELVGVSAATVRRAIRTGTLEVAGYVGVRPRVRRAEVEAWVTRSTSSGGLRRERPPDCAGGRFRCLACPLA